MSTKTLRKRIALVAVSAMGFGLLSVVPASAAIGATTELNFVAAGSTTAVTAEAGAYGAANADEVVYVRSTTATNTFNISAAVAVSGDVYNFYLSNTSTAPATTANLIAITASGTPTGASVAQAAITTADTVASATTKGLAFTTSATSVTNMKFTTGALAAGTYYMFVDATADTTGAVLVAVITSYDVGAPVTLAYNVDGRTQVGSAVNTTVSSRLTDSTGRQTFLVGDETISHSWTYPVTTPASQAPAAVTATTAASTPAYTSAGASFARYSTTLDVTTGTLTKGTVYTLTGVILSGVNAFGNDTMTYVNVATTNGLAGTLALTSASTGAAITSIALANGQATTAANYVLTAKDAAGRVILGVTPVLTASAGTVTTAVGTTVDAGTDSSFIYTAPATGTSATLTFTMFGGSAGNTTLSIPVTIGATYDTAVYAAGMESTGNGGYLETTDTADYDLSSTGAVYAMKLDPANTTSVSADFYLYKSASTNSAFGDAVAGAVLTASIDANSTLPLAQRTLAATTLTTDSTGKVTATIAVNTARNAETLIVLIKSGTATLGTATFTFETAAATISTIFGGPANAITQQFGQPTALTFEAYDQYDQAISNKRLQLTVTGPSAPVGGTTVVVTNASGVANYTVAGATSVTGQSDIVKVTEFEGSGVTAEADDIVTISYVATAPAVASFGIQADLSQGSSWTTYTTETLATAIGVAMDSATATLGAKFEDAKFLPIDSLGNYTDTATKSGANTAARDEVIQLRFRALNASSVALAGVPVVVSASSGAWVVGSLGQAVSTRTLYTDASGYVSVNAFATATGVATWTVTQGAVSASISATYANAAADARFVSVSPATKSVTSGTLAQFVATVTDRYGNVVPGATVTWSELGAGRLEANSGATSATGTSTADFSTYATETGDGVVKAVIAYQGEDLASYVGATKSSYTNGLLIAAAAAGIASSSAAITVDAPTTKSAELLASEANAAAIAAIAAKAASDKAETDAKIKLLEAQIAAAQAASVAAAEAAADAAAEAIDAGNNAFDAATSAGEAADAATAAAEQAGEDATAAATAAGEAAVAAAEAAQEAAAEATDAANAATDAANASAEAADAATAAAQDAADAVAALSTQVSEMISALKKQITSLTNLVIKIQKKVKA
jgi:hypothetical protein